MISTAKKVLREQLKTKTVAHPVLERLKKDLNTSGKTGAVITSYDRMHHRHNRS